MQILTLQDKLLHLSCGNATCVASWLSPCQWWTANWSMLWTHVAKSNTQEFWKLSCIALCCHVDRQLSLIFEHTCRKVSSLLVSFLKQNSRGKSEGFGAIDSMLTKAARLHKVYDLLAVTLQNNRLSQTAVNPAALTQRMCIDCCTL